jgi:hypothetical protein
VSEWFLSIGTSRPSNWGERKTCPVGDNQLMTPRQDEEIRVTIERRVRPIRFGFVVDPSDDQSVLRVFETNTFLWGGRLNPVIPVYSSNPKRWPPRSNSKAALSAVAAATGHLKAFEPDYLVDMADGLAKKLAFPGHFVIKPHEIAYDDARIGLTALQVYEHEYKSTFQFVLREAQEAAFYTFAGFDLLSAATFGWYGSADSPAKRHFAQAFSASSEVVNRSTYWTLLREPKLTPLLAGMFQIERDRFYPFTLFFCNPRSVQDAIDFWNLRALGWVIAPLPQQWADADRLLELVDVNRGRHGVRLMRSFAASRQRWRTLMSRLRPDDDLHVMPSMPPIWRPRETRDDGTWRLNALCSEDEVEVTARDGSLRLPILAPSFFRGNRFSGAAHWANEIRLSHPSDIDRTTTFPHVHEISELVSRWDRRAARQSSEGLITYGRHAREHKYWTLPRSFDVFQNWMHNRGCEVELSGAGRIAMEMARTLGGIRNVSHVKSFELIEFINGLAHTAVESSDDEPTESRVRVGTVPRQRLIEVLRQYVDPWGRQSSAREAESHMRTLLERSVFRVGIKIQCERCSQRNWYALNDVADDIRCERCLQTFSFPASTPHDAKWEYRPIGTFATENYAQGAYGALLAVHFLLGDDGGFSNALWCPGFELKRKDHKTIECDFAVFVPARLAHDELLFAAGEAKSGESRFRAKDFGVCSAFVTAFPGSSFIFATTREQLDDSEKQAIRALVRRHGRTKRSAGAPIAVLCRRELEAFSAPVESWPKDLIEEYRADYASTRLERLARTTQRLYL